MTDLPVVEILGDQDGAVVAASLCSLAPVSVFDGFQCSPRSVLCPMVPPDPTMMALGGSPPAIQDGPIALVS